MLQHRSLTIVALTTLKLLVFAHKPPPHHGQSYMVEMLLKGFGGDQRGQPNRQSKAEEILCYHVDARFSTAMDDIAQPRIGKALNLLRYIAEALWVRFRYGARSLYYAPAPPLKAPLYRDIVVMMILKPFFRHRAFYWHAAGLGEWLPTLPGWLRRMAHFALNGASLSMAPSSFGLPDAEVFAPQVARVVPYGVPDPHPDYATKLRAKRQARADSLKSALANRRDASTPKQTVSLFFMALLTEEKGLLDAVRALAILRSGPYSGSIDFQLNVAGKFLNDGQEKKFNELITELKLQDAVKYIGFVSGEKKTALLADADLLCFPTWYYAESAPLVLFEAMAAGLPIVTTAWRSLPQFFPADYPGIVPIKSPEAVADAVIKALSAQPSDMLRERFFASYSLEAHLRNLRAALLDMQRQERLG